MTQCFFRCDNNETKKYVHPPPFFVHLLLQARVTIKNHLLSKNYSFDQKGAWAQEAIIIYNNFCNKQYNLLRVELRSAEKLQKRECRQVK